MNSKGDLEKNLDKIINLDQLNSEFSKGSVITLGNFDGIHPGHIALIKKTNKIAKIKKLPSVIVTYFPNPILVIAKPGKFPGYILEQDSKDEIISQYNPNYLVVIKFTKEFSYITAYNFLKNVLIDKLNVKHIVLGFDHHFGKNRKGNYEFLLKHSHIFGYTVEKIKPVFYGEEKISSSTIRNYLLEGKVKEANQILGRTFFLRGKVTRGYERGRQIGFPTANIQIADNMIIPAPGVYAAITKFEKKQYKAMVNIGNNPTFGNENISIEGNIFDFNEIIYEKYLEYHLIQRIRNEKKFSSINELIVQLKEDEKTVRNIKF